MVPGRPAWFRDGDRVGSSSSGIRGAGQRTAPVGTVGQRFDRAKLGWKWSLLLTTVPASIGWTGDGPNRNDSILLEATLDDAAGRGRLAEIEWPPRSP